MKIRLRAGLLILGCVSYLMSTAQVNGNSDSLRNVKSFKNELDLDLSNAIFLLRKPENTYLLNYKRHFNNRYALRFGGNLKYQTSKKDGEQFVDVRVGLEKKYPIKKFTFFYGVDFSFSHQGYTYQSNTISKLGLNPLIGFKYAITDRIAFSVEPKLYCFYAIFRDPTAYNQYANTEEFNITLGSFGLVFVDFFF